MLHSQGLSNNSISTLSSNLHLGFPRGFFPVALPVKILKQFLPYIYIIIFGYH